MAARNFADEFVKVVQFAEVIEQADSNQQKESDGVTKTAFQTNLRDHVQSNQNDY